MDPSLLLQLHCSSFVVELGGRHYGLVVVSFETSGANLIELHFKFVLSSYQLYNTPAVPTSHTSRYVNVLSNFLLCFLCVREMYVVFSSTSGS